MDTAPLSSDSILAVCYHRFPTLSTVFLNFFEKLNGKPKERPKKSSALVYFHKKKRSAHGKAARAPGASPPAAAPLMRPPPVPDGVRREECA